MPKRTPVGIELLADPTRRAIVALVAMKLRHPSDFATALGLSRPAISRQLLLLTRAGLLRWTRSTFDRRSRVYIIEPSMEGPILAWLAGVALRNVRPQVKPGWSAPRRVHRLRHDAREIDVY